jgi:hypothetical protein
VYRAELPPSVLWCNRQTKIRLILRSKPKIIAVILSPKSLNRNCRFGDPNQKTVIAGFEAKPSGIITGGFDAKPLKTIAASFDAKPLETVAAGFEVKPLETVTTDFEAKLAKIIVISFKAKPEKTVPVVLRSNY